MDVWTRFRGQWRQEEFQKGQVDKDYVQRLKASFTAAFKVFPPLIATTARASQRWELLMDLEIFSTIATSNLSPQAQGSSGKQDLKIQLQKEKTIAKSQLFHSHFNSFLP